MLPCSSFEYVLLYFCRSTGTYDENNSRLGIMRAGGPDFFATPALEQFQGQEIPWRMNGKIDTQGFFVAIINIWEDTGAVVSQRCLCIFLLVIILLSFIRDVTITTEDVIALDTARRAMDTYLGLQSPVWDQVGLGDVEWYLRFGSVWEYMLKFRRVAAGGRFPVLFLNMALQRNPDNPASLAF